MVGLERGTALLESYDPAWTRAYEREVTRLRSLETVEERVLTFEHVGSTAIEGLAAKPIVDLLALTETRSDVETVVPTLTEHGYEHRPNDSVEDRVFLAKGPHTNRTHYLSLCERGSETHLEQVTFRDYLRGHTEVADEYERLKRTLANRYADDRESYTAEKAAFVQDVLERAQDSR